MRAADSNPRSVNGLREVQITPFLSLFIEQMKFGIWNLELLVFV